MAQSKTITVSSAAQLKTAIAGLKGGETVLLAAGDYGNIAIKGKAFSAPVTFKSADPNHDAVLTDLRIDKVSNLRIEDIDIHHVLAVGETDATQAVYISNSANIDLIGIDFTGSMDGNSWNDGVALRAETTTGLRLIDSTFEQFNNAAVFYYLTGAVIAGNSVTDVREGFDFAAVTNVTIAQNRFSGFTPNYAKGDHSDSIQFWNNGVSKGSSHVIIEDNIFLQGANGGTQGVFVRAENVALRHSDFTVVNNLYYGDARNGITLNGVDGGLIAGNTLVSAPGGALETGIVLSGDRNIVVDHNITPLLLQMGTNPGVTMTNNIDSWDTAQKKGVALADLFQPGSGAIDFSSFLIKSGSVADVIGAGFHANVDIGAGAFDLGHALSYGHLAGLLPAIA